MFSGRGERCERVVLLHVDDCVGMVFDGYLLHVVGWVIYIGITHMEVRVYTNCKIKLHVKQILHLMK